MGLIVSHGAVLILICQRPVCFSQTSSETVLQILFLKLADTPSDSNIERRVSQSRGCAVTVRDAVPRPGGGAVGRRWSLMSSLVAGSFRAAGRSSLGRPYYFTDEAAQARAGAVICPRLLDQ